VRREGSDLQRFDYLRCDAGLRRHPSNGEPSIGCEILVYGSPQRVLVMRSRRDTPAFCIGTDEPGSMPCARTEGQSGSCSKLIRVARAASPAAPN
jgi:hypothetical protein